MTANGDAQQVFHIYICIYRFVRNAIFSATLLHGFLVNLTEMHGVKLQKKLLFIQNGIYKCRYDKLAMHFQWQRIEELG